MWVEAGEDGRGRTVARKRAVGADECRRLRREADLLEIATHPGLVELLGFDDGPETELRTAWIDGWCAAGDHPLDVEEVAGLAAAVASTVADLHDIGVVHAALAAEHVIVDGDGRPVLCSLGYGGLTGERGDVVPALPAGAVDPARSPGDPLDPCVDVYGVGAVLMALLRHTEGRGRGGGADGLRRLAQRAMSSDRAERPAARQLADAIHDAVGGARLPRSEKANDLDWAWPTPAGDPPRVRATDAWRPSLPPPRRSPMLVRSVAFGMGVLAVAAVAALLIQRGSTAGTPVGAGALPATTTPVPPPATAIRSEEQPAPSRFAGIEPGRAGCAPVDASLAADVDGDGCAEAVRFTEGVVEAGGLRWLVGEAGDLGAIGDWTCSGTRSLAVLRPRTGAIYAFPRWASGEEPVSAVLVEEVSGARALRAADLDGDGCNELFVERGSGSTTVVRVPRGAP